MITFNDFEKIDIRVGTIVQTSVNDKANKLSMLLIIDFGDSVGLKKTSAQLIQNYNPDDLLGKQVAAVINFPPKQIGKMISEVLVLGFPDKDKNPILIMPSQKVPNGGKLF
jgi:tRNA-binding protein